MPTALLAFLGVVLAMAVATLVVQPSVKAHSYSNAGMVEDLKSLVRSINRLAPTGGPQGPPNRIFAPAQQRRQRADAEGASHHRQRGRWRRAHHARDDLADPRPGQLEAAPAHAPAQFIQVFGQHPLGAGSNTVSSSAMWCIRLRISSSTAPSNPMSSALMRRSRAMNGADGCAPAHSSR